MPIAIEESALYNMVKSAVKETMEEELEQEIRPRLNEVIRILALLEEEFLSLIASQRLSEIESGIQTVPLEKLEEKYGL